jgi:DNA-binding PadR family transcriptional regulator
MFTHLILGLLRDGEPHHGYELVTTYRVRSGNKVSPGNFYRELMRLATSGLVQTRVNPPDADTRRIPYQITERGRQEFDRWLEAPTRLDEDLSGWILFADLATPEVRARVLDRYQEDLWMRSKVLTRTREDALRDHPQAARGEEYDPLPALVSRQMKQTAAEIEFVEEFRSHVSLWESHRPRAEAEVAPIPLAPRSRRRGAPPAR